MARAIRAGRRGVARSGDRNALAEGGGSRGKRNAGTARFRLERSIWSVAAEFLTDLAEDMTSLSKAISADPSDRGQAKAMVSSFAKDPRYSAISPVFGRIQVRLQAGDWVGARDLAIEVLDAVWDRSPEYDVGRDAFIRRIRGKGFKPTSYRDPLMGDRAAAMAMIMQADKAALDEIVRETPKPSELVIELTGEFDVVRLVKVD